MIVVSISFVDVGSLFASSGSEPFFMCPYIDADTREDADEHQTATPMPGACRRSTSSSAAAAAGHAGLVDTAAGRIAGVVGEAAHHPTCQEEEERRIGG
jgi:hypothetical protein